MSPWEYLEIESTSDERLIKKAYADRLKKINIEEDKESFMLLRKAYEEAISFSRENLEIFSEYKFESDDEKNEKNIESFFEKENRIEFFSHEDSATKDTPENNFDFDMGNINISNFYMSNYKIAETLLSDFIKILFNGKGKRKRLVHLNDFFEKEELWYIEVKSIFLDLLFDFFSKPRINDDVIILPKEIWLKINNFCLWKEQEIWLYENYPFEKVETVLYPIRKALKEKVQPDTKYILESFTFIPNESAKLEFITIGSEENHFPFWIYYIVSFFLIAFIKQLASLFK